jgi:hypothetical protein
MRYCKVVVGVRNRDFYYHYSGKLIAVNNIFLFPLTYMKMRSRMDILDYKYHESADLKINLYKRFPVSLAIFSPLARAQGSLDDYFGDVFVHHG